MPEIKNTFTSGKMNKDLDERLVPNGEYRDALNVDVSTSETSDVGAIENSFGNTLKSGDFINNGSYIANATCVGSIVNKEKGTIIWLVNGSNIDAIVEYDPETEVVEPILIDNFTDASKGNQIKFLNFSSTNIITGINMIGDMLFWTDGINEPKKINISNMKRGVDGSDPWRKTNVLVKESGVISKGDDDTDNYVEEKHITIIKKAPFSSPNISLSDTERISEGSDESTVHNSTKTTHISVPIDAGLGALHDNIYSSTSGAALIFNNDVSFDTVRATNASGDAFPNVIFVDPSTLTTAKEWKTWLGCDSERHVRHITTNGKIRRYEIDETHHTGGIDHTTGRIYLKCDAVALTVNIGERIILAHHLQEFNNESFWTYKDSNAKVLPKPPGTNNIGKLENDDTYLKDGGFLDDGSGVDFTPRFDEDDIILSSPDSAIPAPSGGGQQNTSALSGWHKLAPVANISGSTPGYNEMYADSSDARIIYDSTNASDILVGMVVTDPSNADVVQLNTKVVSVTGSSPQIITLDKAVTENFSTDSSNKTTITFIMPNGLLMRASTNTGLTDDDQFLYRAIPENTSTRDGLIPGHFYKVSMDIAVTAIGTTSGTETIAIRNNFGVGKDLRATFSSTGSQSVSGVFQYDPHGDFNAPSTGMGGSWDTPSGAGLIFIKDIKTAGTIKNINIECITKPRPVRIQELMFYGKPDYTVGDTVELTLADNPLNTDADVKIKVALTRENIQTTSVTEFPTYTAATTVGTEVLHASALNFSDASKWTIGSSGWTIGSNKATSATSTSGTLDATTSNGGLTTSLVAGNWYKLTYTLTNSTSTGSECLQLTGQAFNLSDTSSNAIVKLLSNNATHTIYFRQGTEDTDRLRFFVGNDPDLELSNLSLKPVTMSGQIDFKSTGSNQSRKAFECEIVSIDDSVAQLTPGQAKKWNAVRVKKEALHQENFARFAYRWKYEDNQYSAFSPFTKVAFLPSSEYDYDTEEGFNKSMINDVRRITLNNFDPAPEDVVEVDILYKASNSTAVYSLKTIKASDSAYSLNSLSSLADDPLEVSITSEMVHAVLPENQLLRQYDNVPRTAKAQEVTANRLLYGNYEQQYDLQEEPVIKCIVASNRVEQGQLPKESIKSLRKYQVGVALLDKYGRTTPVFSNDSLNVVNLGQELSNKSNTLKAKLTSLPPDFATHYKFYVKDPSAEYYNLCMDRFYPAEESDQVWISFPSSDINKVKEEDYLILKKSHDGTDDFQATAGKVFRYKVMAIETSPPAFVANEKKLIGVAPSCNFTTSSINESTGYPLKGRVIVRVNASKFASTQAALDILPEQTVGTKKIMDNTFIRIYSNKQGTASNYYKVEKITYDLANSVNYYEFELVDAFADDISFTGAAPGSSSRLLDLELYKSNPNDYKAEFDGRFFVKIIKDLEFNNHILKTYSTPTREYGVVASQKLHWLHNYISGQNAEGYESDDLDYQKDTFNFAESEQTLSLDTTIVGPVDDGSLGGLPNDTRATLATSNPGVFAKSDQMWVIDSGFSWMQKEEKDLINSKKEHNNTGTTGNMGKHMGCGFLLGNKHADFRVVNIGDGTEPGDDQNEGYKFDRKSSVFKQFFENWPIYDKLKTAGTKFRWQNDPTNTIYTISAAEVLDVNNYTNDDDDSDFHKRSNQGVRIHIELDKPIAWTPTDPAALIGEQVFGVGVTSSSSGDGYISPLDNDTSLTGPYRLANTSTLEILQDLPNEDTFASSSPAIFESEPKERVDLNLYYETSDAILIPKTGMKITTDYLDPATGVSALISTATITCDARYPEQFYINHGTHNKTNGTYSSLKQTCDIPAGVTFKIHRLDNNGNITHSRSFVLSHKLVKPGSIYVQATRSGSTTSGPITSVNQRIILPLHNLKYYNCFSFGNGVESNRVRDDFNSAIIDKGARVSSVLKVPYRKEHKQNGIIYSGIYNYDSGINRLNEFNQAEKITKFVNPDYGSIQKLFTRNTNVLAFCENKILKILANKDALFNADGNTNLTSTNNVLGQAIPFAGEYGIAKNPESFANFGYRIYFTDKNRNAILRLSGDGLTDISVYGMDSWFKDNLKPSSTILGTYDEDKDNYNLTLNNYTVSFNDNVNGWNSFKSFIPESGVSLKGYYYTFKDGNLWLHNLNENRNQFYGVEYDSTVKFLLNENPSDIKVFKTLSYEGTQSQAYTSNSVTTEGWYASSITTDKQSGEILEFVEKEGKWFNNIKGVDTDATSIDLKELAVQGIGTALSVAGPSPVYRLIRVTITSTESDADVPVKWRVTSSVTDSSTTASKKVDLFIAANASTATSHYFYVHGLNINGNDYTVDTITGSFVCSGSGALSYEDGYNNNGTWTASSAHVGLTTNIIRVGITQTTATPTADVKQTRNVTGTAYLKQN
tara:strand:- start:3983 stop:11149 length:7167 start_codon:yes stop_codon:yes gene_type:complete